MSSNPLMMGYGGGDLLRTGAVWPTVGPLQACVCRLWVQAVGSGLCGQRLRARDESALEVAPPDRRLDRRPTAFTTRRCAIEIDNWLFFSSSVQPADRSPTAIAACQSQLKSHNHHHRHHQTQNLCAATANAALHFSSLSVTSFLNNNLHYFQTMTITSASTVLCTRAYVYNDITFYI